MHYHLWLKIIEYAVHQVSIGNCAFNNCQVWLRGQIISSTGGIIIDHQNNITPGKQLVCHMRTNKTRPTCNQYPHCCNSFCCAIN